MIIDKLYAQVAQKGHVCVGLDTDYSYLPASFAAHFPSVGEAIAAFNKAVIDATIDVTACYKVQIAYYEAYGVEGLLAYKRTLHYLREHNAVVIADIKRGDIAKTAEMYAKAHFTGDFEADFITLNPYMGMDSIEPYLPYIKEKEKGLFVLVRTSNKGAKDVEYLSVSGEKKVYNVVGEYINHMGKDFLGSCGFSSIGGVMGCTHSDEAAKVRDELDSTFFLIPGYGAQGGTAKDIVLYLKNGNGGVVNASRSVLLAYTKVEHGEDKFDVCSRQEVINMRDNIQTALLQK